MVSHWHHVGERPPIRPEALIWPYIRVAVRDEQVLSMLAHVVHQVAQIRARGY